MSRTFRTDSLELKWNHGMGKSQSMKLFVLIVLLLCFQLLTMLYTPSAAEITTTQGWTTVNK